LGDLLHLIGRYGYLVVFFGVVLESAGVPLIACRGPEPRYSATTSTAT